MDTTTSDLSVDDTALFSAVTSGTDLPEAEVPVTATTTDPATTTAPATTAAPVAEEQPASVPSSRLREESERARNAERERDDLRAEIARLRATPQQPRTEQQPQAPKEIWDDPKAFVQEAVSPLEQAMRRQGEAISRRFAVQEFGQELVNAAFEDMKQARATDPASQVELQRILSSDHPFGELVAWHKNRLVLKEVGSDPAAYRNRILEEALKNPEFLGKAVEAARAGAQATVETPGRPAATSMPSIRTLGTSAAPAAVAGEPSDAELFHSTTSRRRTG
jgi:hypothetical protein